jgi:hypothetical protein
MNCFSSSQLLVAEAHCTSRNGNHYRGRENLVCGSGIGYQRAGREVVGTPGMRLDNLAEALRQMLLDILTEEADIVILQEEERVYIVAFDEEALDCKWEGCHSVVGHRQVSPWVGRNLVRCLNISEYPADSSFFFPLLLPSPCQLIQDLGSSF